MQIAIYCSKLFSNKVSEYSLFFRMSTGKSPLKFRVKIFIWRFRIQNSLYRGERSRKFVGCCTFRVNFRFKKLREHQHIIMFNFFSYLWFDQMTQRAVGAVSVRVINQVTSVFGGTSRRDARELIELIRREKIAIFRDRPNGGLEELVVLQLPVLLHI